MRDTDQTRAHLRNEDARDDPTKQGTFDARTSASRFPRTHTTAEDSHATLARCTSIGTALRIDSWPSAFTPNTVKLVRGDLRSRTVRSALHSRALRFSFGVINLLSMLTISSTDDSGRHRHADPIPPRQNQVHRRSAL